jgi:hypothetical protein
MINSAQFPLNDDKEVVAPSASALRTAADRSTELPDGQISENRVQPPLKKYSDFPKTQITLYPPPSRPTEGRLMIVTAAGRDAVDADGAIDERRLMRTAKSCGPDTPTLVSSLRKATFAGDGGKQARSPGRARSSLLKPLRRECRVNRCDRGDYARVLFPFCTRGCGRIERPAFPAPSDWRVRKFPVNLGRVTPRDREAVSAMAAAV